ncbi:S-layer homology domain-containing protein [Paenibacillus sp. 32352]|uniref:S-layer homology domain-containing protein n=1 Tax=Paenibacillus sp. 32352 TaxID=1969111 RepID=UPI0015C44BF0|nr:S-layer homology domain-containing protein [Paenibacillus sp. 32352]
MKKIALILTLAFSLVFGATAASAQGTTFSDVSDTKHSWAVKAIGFMSEHGVIKGYSDGTFKPDAGVTKAEFVSMFSRLFDKYATNDSRTREFKDVPADNWAYDSVSKVMSDYTYFTYSKDDSGTYFHPNTELTRLGAVNLMPVLYDELKDKKVIYNTLHSMNDIKVYDNVGGYDKDGRFDETTDRTNAEFPIIFKDEVLDDDYSAIVGTKIASLQTEGLMTAYEGSFSANKTLTRAEAATTLYRLYTQLKGDGDLSKYSTIQ